MKKKLNKPPSPANFSYFGTCATFALLRRYASIHRSTSKTFSLEKH